MYLCLGWWASLVAQLVKIRLQCRRPWFDSWVGKIPWRRDRLPIPVFLVFPGGSDSKEFACNKGDLGSIPGLRRSPRGVHGNPLQYSCLENPQGQKSLQSMELQRVGHDWATKHSTAHVKIFRHAGIYTYDTPVCTCNNPLYMLLHILLFSLSGIYEESSKHYINSCCVYWLHYYPLSTQSFMKVLPPSHLSYLLGLASPGYNNRTP